MSVKTVAHTYTNSRQAASMDVGLKLTFRLSHILNTETADMHRVGYRPETYVKTVPHIQYGNSRHASGRL